MQSFPTAETFPSLPGDDDQWRTIFLDGGYANDGFCSNRVVTAKYNVVTFLPIFLFEMFSRLAYLYFLLQVYSSALSSLSSSLLCLCFVVLVIIVVVVVFVCCLNTKYSSLQPPQATLSWISIISPYTPYGPTLGLTFVLLVGAVTAIWQDVKRHKEDSLMNSSVAHVMQEDGTLL